MWGDWDRPYITLQPEYEAAQLRVFGDMFLKGHIYRCLRGHVGVAFFPGGGVSWW